MIKIYCNTTMEVGKQEFLNKHKKRIALLWNWYHSTSKEKGRWLFKIASTYGVPIEIFTDYLEKEREILLNERSAIN